MYHQKRTWCKKWKTLRSKIWSRNQSPLPSSQLIHFSSPRDGTQSQTKRPGWYGQQVTFGSTCEGKLPGWWSQHCTVGSTGEGKLTGWFWFWQLCGNCRWALYRPQHQEDHMLPTFVQPRRSGTYTKAPLHIVEHGASSDDPGNSNGGCDAVSSFAVVVVGHECGRDAVELLGWTECWLGLVVGTKNPEPTWHRPKHHNTRSADGGTSGLAGKTSN